MADTSPQPTTADAEAAAFVERWRGVQLTEATEIGSSQTFVIELCRLLGAPTPLPTAEMDYVFERPVTFAHGDGTASSGRIDCYRRGAFVWESKKLRYVKAGTKAFDTAMLTAHAQAQNYARALPAGEGRPPFLLVADVGNVIEVFSEFSRSGATYTPFPDPRSHRIALEDLRSPDIRARLAAIWNDPLSLDPSRASARVTREVAAKLAELAKSLEQGGQRADHVAGFLTRCLFSMFAEDIELLPQGSFLKLLEEHRAEPKTLALMLRALWADMDRGGFSAALRGQVLRFNGKLFKESGADGYTLELTQRQIDLLVLSAKSTWREVEPAIFGTLLERALDPDERHALGAHYTPRAYVERLVLPTVIEPLRGDWANAQAAALVLAQEDKLDEARAEIKRFHHQLCTVRVLDPACGSGNFLYVTLEHLKRLEGEVFNQLEALSTDTDSPKQNLLGMEGETVTLKQLLGIEINPRAAAVAELVLWIGYLQWHIRTRGNKAVAEPVVHDYGNIECRDAVLAWRDVELAKGKDGKPLMRWDGKTFKTHPVTGKQVPDEEAQVPQWKYLGAKKAEWPQADFIVGNPPFIGNKRMRDSLGDGYTEALRSVWTEVPETADFVMYWWERAASLTATRGARRFGLITTNSIRQTFNRQSVERHLSSLAPISIVYAVPDHPWVENANGAAVRIAITVGTSGRWRGALQTVVSESSQSDGEANVVLTTQQGEINADLTIGAAVSRTTRLVSNLGLSFQGMNLVGKGFCLDSTEIGTLGYDATALPDVIKPYRNARDMMQRRQTTYVIDFYGYGADQARESHPPLYQRLFDRVKPERDLNNRPARKERWWLFGETVGKLRRAWIALPRFIATPETSKHRIFEFVDLPFCPDHKLYAICVADPFVLGVLSSRLHALWSLATGGRQGVGNDPVYNNTRCFETFPFPDAIGGLTPAVRERVAKLATTIDTHRKARQHQHPDLTLTGMYNVVEALREGRPLTAKEKKIHEDGFCTVLKGLHADLDAAVLEAYGWDTNQGDGELLEELVGLNAKRAAEEQKGLVRWLRPEFQNPSALLNKDQTIESGRAVQADLPLKNAAQAAEMGQLIAWPSTLPEQVRAVAQMLSAQPSAIALADLESRFKGRGPWKRSLPRILETLEALGRARRDGAQWRA